MNPKGRLPTHGHAKRGSKTTTYKKWMGMHRRCRGHSAKDAKDYTARGITVCERWSSYEAFLSDMGECPPSMTLDRIDSAKGYSPDNCRWADAKTQSTNRRNVRLFTYKGESLHLYDWSRRTGIGQATLFMRLKAGWPLERALSVSPDIYKNR